ncbi:hypothetical protein ACFWNH_30445 [Rhodococcus qingshengii]|uniref:hypothetical protein n=1 Tax=Rhodococcus qingshengii TaxID=334542 RepID=UPI0036619118
MTDVHGKSHEAVRVGSLIRVVVGALGDKGSPTCPGVVIEDYADMVIDSTAAGRDWAPVRRWAVALDDGRLIFVDDDKFV